MPTPVFVTATELATALGGDETDALKQLAERTNEIIAEKWANPTNPAPASVKIIAFNAAMRVATNPKGLTSWTRSWDDITRTERIEGARRLGLYLSDEELAELNGTQPLTRRAKSIRLSVPRLGC